MKFRTEIHIDKANFDINHQSRLISLGSCFSEHIGTLLCKNKFDILPNPFGILYNPASIAAVTKLIMDGYLFQKEDLVFHNNQYHSFMHHGSFSSDNLVDTLKTINESLVQANKAIQNRDIFLITFGTAYLFKHSTTMKVVSNCHKFPSQSFVRERLTVNQIVEEWIELIKTIQSKNEKVKFIFTVSPIRHWKDGAHENQLSKSILLLAIDELKKRCRNVFYFPAYELMIDDLRDYRFYAEDMMHPSSVAVKYIWKKFMKTYFNNEIKLFIKSWTKIQKAIEHRPNNQNRTNYAIFVQQTYKKLKEFQQQHPLIDFNTELQLLIEKNTI